MKQDWFYCKEYHLAMFTWTKILGQNTIYLKVKILGMEIMSLYLMALPLMNLGIHIRMYEIQMTM